MAKYGISKKKQTVKDFVKFGTAMIQTGDIDPQFWIIRDYYERNKVDANTAIWLSAVYLLYYHMGSTTVAWKLYPEPMRIKKKDWDTSLIYFKQRRCFRGNTHARTQINEIMKVTGGDLVGWTEELVGAGGGEGWTRVREAYEALPYIGPWASYKWCDMVKFIHRYPITSPDVGNKPGATAGPIAGLASLTGLPRQECADNPKIYQYLYDYVTGEMGMPLIGLDHLESCLCDWQSIINGRYYHGHDIDRDLQQLRAYPENDLSKAFYDARARIFDHRYLGEKQDPVFGGWDGARPELKSAYRNQGEIVNVHEDAKKVDLL